MALFCLISSFKSVFLASSQKRDKKAAMTIISVAMTIIRKVDKSQVKIRPKVDAANSSWGRRLMSSFFFFAMAA